MRTRKLFLINPRNPAGLAQSPNFAIGAESLIIVAKFQEFMNHFLEPISREWEDPVGRFQRLKTKWKEETIYSSSLDEITRHPAYQQIIGMGPIAVPLIMEELQIAPSHWFWALKSITGHNPVLPSHRGSLKAMAGDWLAWYRRCEERGELICAAVS
ncbi:MAG: hypothetical protein ABSG91_24655 [Syntrophobacteraceae bacterium]|jgi:hypothetical protein